MRKLVQISLLSIYLLFTMGITASIHYCGGKVKSISVQNPLFSHDSDSGDSCCPDSCQSSCCDEKILQMKIEDVHQAKAPWNLFSLDYFFQEYDTNTEISYLSASQISFRLNVNHSPPDGTIHITNCAFLI